MTMVILVAGAGAGDIESDQQTAMSFWALAMIPGAVVGLMRRCNG
jgi:hypothetical protein